MSYHWGPPVDCLLDGGRYAAARFEEEKRMAAEEDLSDFFDAHPPVPIEATKSGAPFAGRLYALKDRKVLIAAFVHELGRPGEPPFARFVIADAGPSHPAKALVCSRSYGREIDAIRDWIRAREPEECDSSLDSLAAKLRDSLACHRVTLEERHAVEIERSIYSI